MVHDHGDDDDDGSNDAWLRSLFVSSEIFKISLMTLAGGRFWIQFSFLTASI